MEKFKFYNNILGYYKTKEEMDKDIRDSGVLLKSDGESWGVPLSKMFHKFTVRGLWKKGDPYWGVASQYTNWKNKQEAQQYYAEKEEKINDEIYLK